MINRILIRTKVVQLLYSYLLIQKHFMLESQPTPPTKEKRYAYKLYLDMLVLMIKVAERIEMRGGERPLYETRFIKNVVNDEKIRSLLTKFSQEPFPFESAVDELAKEIAGATIYKNYLKKADADSNDDVIIWQKIFSKIIVTNQLVKDLARNMDDFSPRGEERMADLMAETFKNFLSSQGQIADALKSLDASLEKARELYFRLLTLPVAITRLREQEIDEAQHKYLQTEEDRFPNMRFVDNELVKVLATNPIIQDWCEEHKIDWLQEDRTLIASLLRAIKESDVYYDYMNFPVTDFITDCEFWRNVFKYIILENPTFLEALEDKSLFWNDDLEIIGTFALKTIKHVQDDYGQNIDFVMPMFKDEEDERFGRELFTAVVCNRDEYRQMINDSLDSSSWEAERLAFMDVVIMLCAIAEILNFPKIPTSVSVNEYIEIAKAYSTPRSGAFVHGILGGVIARLHESGQLMKE